MSDKPRKQTRREFIADGARVVGLLAVGGTLGSLARCGEAQDTVWQIDPDKCIACSNCATECVLTPSAVKCVHEYERCGYCELCFGFFEDRRIGDDEGAENQRCPTGAIRRSFVEEPYYEYVIDEPKCVGCGVCVKGCQAYGNGALILQVRHDRCVNCNECAIAAKCPADAFVRVPADRPYLLHSRAQAEELEQADRQGRQYTGPPATPEQPASVREKGSAPAQGEEERGPRVREQSEEGPGFSSAHP